MPNAENWSWWEDEREFMAFLELGKLLHPRGMGWCENLLCEGDTEGVRSRSRRLKPG